MTSNCSICGISEDGHATAMVAGLNVCEFRKMERRLEEYEKALREIEADEQQYPEGGYMLPRTRASMALHRTSA